MRMLEIYITLKNSSYIYKFNNRHDLYRLHKNQWEYYTSALSSQFGMLVKIDCDIDLRIGNLTASNHIQILY